MSEILAAARNENNIMKKLFPTKLNSLKDLGFRMPAEWETHEATWLAWPHNPDTWPGAIEKVPPIWMKMIQAIAPYEKVNLCVNDAETEKKVRQQLEQNGIRENVFLHQIPTNDAWARDHGPVFLKRAIDGREELAITDWIFNSWGKKYGKWNLDDVVPKRISEKFDLPYYEPGIVLEGGSIDVNGKGTLLTTEQCLLNKNRNPHLSKNEIEEYLKNYLGVSHILWLGEGIVGDDTDGHIDDITRFVNPNTVITVVEEDPADENYLLLQDNLKRLQSMKDQEGNSLNILTLPMPGPVLFEDQRLPASYANFYITNGSVLVPTYRHSNDAKALEILQKVFPERKVIGIDCTNLVWGLGAIHCVTQQQPKI